MPVIVSFNNAKEMQKSIQDLKRFKNKVVAQEKLQQEALRKELVKKFIVPLMRKLKKYPPKRVYPGDYPIKFTSEKQRRYVMMMLKGKPYIRTHGLRRAWRYKTTVKNGVTTFIVSNNAKSAKYVVGKWGRSEKPRQIKEYLKPMQKFHRVTGWTPAYEEINKTSKKMTAYAVKSYKKWLNSLFS